MRRKDREQDASFALEVFDSAPYVTVSMVKPSGQPYGLPLSVVRTDDTTLYFHGALVGEKMDALCENPVVSLSAVAESTPFFEQRTGNFTLAYRSATAVGRAEIVTDDEEKIVALRALCQRFLPDYMQNFDHAISKSLSRTAIVRIKLQDPPVGKMKKMLP